MTPISGSVVPVEMLNRLLSAKAVTVCALSLASSDKCLSFQGALFAVSGSGLRNSTRGQSSSQSERCRIAISPVNSFSMTGVYLPKVAAALHLAR
jgi:hypothetical protein